ncbi:DUF3800 domain-containing protein [bacterium]|nr:DUF3800 domain-containing protein [bacterium]
MYIFLDESGNFTGDKNRYFIVGGFLTGNARRTAKAFRKWQRRKFPKKLRYKNEVKFNNTGLNDELRLKTLSYFTKQDIRIFYTFLKTRNIPKEYRKKAGIETGFLYAEVVAKTLNLLLPTTDLEFRIFRDKRHLYRLTQAKFNERIKLDLLPKLLPRSLFQIEAIDSATNPNIQIADWICGALFRYHNNRKNGDKFFITLKNNIVASEELFKDYWANKKLR